MFKELDSFARTAPVTFTIFPADNDQLRVVITQKKEEDDDHIPLNLVVTGSPDELDRDLPLAIAESSAIPAKSVKDQVAAQAAANHAAGEDDDKTPARSTSKKKSAGTKRKVEAKKPVKKSPEPTKTPVITPLIKPLEEKRPAQAAKPAASGRGDKKEAKKAAALQDLQAAIAVHGDNVTRKQFAATNPASGRSFETLFGGWDSFREAGLAPKIGKALEKIVAPAEASGVSDTKPAGDETKAADGETTSANPETPAATAETNGSSVETESEITAGLPDTIESAPPPADAMQQLEMLDQPAETKPAISVF